MQAFSSLIFLALLVGVFYFLLIRPQRRRVEQHRQLIDSLRLGDDIVTIGGIHGTIRRLGDEDIEVEVAPGTTLRFVKSAIARKLAGELAEEAGSEPGDLSA